MTDGRMGPHRAIEAWWGEQLDDALIDRICRAPDDHISEFWDYYDSPNHFILPSRGPGILRPRVLALGDPLGRDNVDLALSVLLYAHQVIVDDLLYRALKQHEDRANMRDALQRIKTLRELELADVVFFEQSSHKFLSKADHPALSFARLVPGRVFGEALRRDDLPGLREYMDLYFADRDPLPADVEAVLGEVAFIVVTTLSGARGIQPERWHPFARTLLEASLMAAAMDDAGSRDPDARPVALTKLAAMAVPTLSVSARDLAAVRKSEESFLEWRQALQQALEQVELMSSTDETWSKSAREIVAAELRPVVAKVERSARKSPFLSAAKSGIRNFGIAGLGAVAGAMVGGNLPSAAVGAGASKAAESAGTYISALRQRRSDKALLQLALSFTDRTEP